MIRKRKWRLGLALTLTALLLGGCSFGSAPEPNDNFIQGETISPEGSDSRPSDPSREETQEKDHLVRSRLTNQWVTADAYNTRPIAVMTPNEVHAIPHYNLSKASILYEAGVEGRMTRMMAIYEDWKELEQIGNVRSLRSYFAYWSFEWDAILIHFGGPYFISNLLEMDTTDSIDGTYDGTAYFRTDDREAPHNAFASGAGILEAASRNGIELENRGLAQDPHFLFAEESAPNTLAQYGSRAQNAAFIDMTAAYPLTRCYFQYNDEDGLYYRFQHLSGGTDGPHVDAATGEQLTFTNILVQNIVTEEIGDGYLAMQCHDTTRDGWFFTHGKGIHVTWQKIGDFGATRFFDDDGNEIVLNTGKTMILVIRDGAGFSFR